MKIAFLKLIPAEGADPEQYLIVYSDPEHISGPFMNTGEQMSENDLRFELAKRGITPTEIDDLINKARYLAEEAKSKEPHGQ
jgi:hypothetical protein